MAKKLFARNGGSNLEGPLLKFQYSSHHFSNSSRVSKVETIWFLPVFCRTGAQQKFVLLQIHQSMPAQLDNVDCTLFCYYLFEMYVEGQNLCCASALEYQKEATKWCQLKSF